MDVNIYIWGLTILGIVLLLSFDFIFISRKPHEVSIKEASIWSIFYIAVAVLFGLGLLYYYGSGVSTEYYTAYIVEKSLSVDNLFVFVLILTHFLVPSVLHQRVLLIGIILALVMRGIFIALGAAMLSLFSFTFVIFGVFLIFTGIQLARHRNEDPDLENSRIIKTIRKTIPYTDEYHGTKLFAKINGRKVATPLLIVMVAIGLTDLLFALDSIPATFGVTQEPYLVFAANAFALLGLRALYFLVKGLLDKLVYLSLGLAVILIFIGIKLVLAYGHTINESIPHIQTQYSLGFIVLTLTIVTVASVLKVRKNPGAVAHAGKIFETKKTNPSKTSEKD